MSKQKVTAYTAIIIAMTLWASSFIWYKEAYAYFNPITIIFLRIAIASAVFLVIRKAIKTKRKLKPQHYKHFIVLALFEPFLYFMAEAHGLKYISVTAASVIISLIPLLTPIAAHIFLKQRVNTKHTIGLGVSFMGVCLVVLAGDGTLSADLLGVALMFVAVISALGYIITLAKLVNHYDTITIMTCQNTIAVILFLPFLLIFEFDTITHPPMTIEAYLPIIKLGIFASIIAFSLFVYSVKHIGITIANMFSYLVPSIAAILAYIILGEQIAVQSIVGIITVIIGLGIPHMTLRKNRQNPQTIG